MVGVDGGGRRGAKPFGARRLGRRATRDAGKTTGSVVSTGAGAMRNDGVLLTDKPFVPVEALDAYDEATEPLFYREGELWRSVIGQASKFSALWFGVLGASQAVFRTILAPTWPNFFESIADGVILTLIVAPAAAALASFAYEKWCGFRLGMLAPFLPYTLSPYASKNPSEKLRDLAFAKAFKNRKLHRTFAKIKAAQTYAAEVCSQFATAAVEAPRRALAVALALKAFSITNVSTMNPFLDALLLVTLAVASISVNLLERRRGPARVLKEMVFVESEYLRAQTKGNFLCRWASDPYENPAEINATSKDKALTNAAVADALVTSCEVTGIEPETSMALVLDAADGRTSLELAAKGVPLSSIWVPNMYTHVVHSLRTDIGINAVATKVEGLLACRDPRECQMQVIYLDHCGAVDNRTQHLWDVFSRHTIADGGVFAVTFSTRGKRSGNTKAKAIQLAAQCIVEAAEAHGYILEGNAAPNVSGLVDYTVAVRTELGDAENTSKEAQVAEVLRLRAKMIEQALEVDDDGMIATAMALWLKDSEAQNASDKALETGKDRRRRKLVDDITKKVIVSLQKDKKIPTTESRTLRSLAREVVDAARATANLRDPALVAIDEKREAVERTYPKCMYLYKTLMFFVFRVRIAR